MLLLRLWLWLQYFRILFNWPIFPETRSGLASEIRTFGNFWCKICLTGWMSFRPVDNENHFIYLSSLNLFFHLLSFWVEFSVIDVCCFPSITLRCAWCSEDIMPTPWYVCAVCRRIEFVWKNYFKFNFFVHSITFFWGGEWCKNCLLLLINAFRILILIVARNWEPINNKQ